MSALALSLLILAGGWTPRTGHICGPDLESTMASRHVYGLVEYDHQLGMLTRRLGTKDLQVLLEAMDAGGAGSITAIALLTDVVRQEALLDPRDFERIDHAAMPPAEPSRSMVEVLRWHVALRAIEDPQDRAAFLASELERRERWNVRWRVIDALADLGERGDEVLRAYLESVKQRSIDSESLRRATLAREKIRLTHLPGSRVEPLADTVRSAGRGFPERELAIWALSRLAALRPTSDPTLRRLSRDEALTDELRTFAAFALANDDPELGWRW